MYDTDRPEITPISQEHKAYMHRIRRYKALVLITQAAILICFFALWEAAAYLKWIDPFIFSSPSRVIKAAFSMALDGRLFYHIWVTLSETVVGFLLGTIIGTLAAALLWWNRFLEKVLNPYLVVLNSLPKTALAPIMIVWLGNNVKSIIATALLISVVVTIITVLTGFMLVDKDKIKLIETFGGKKYQILLKVVIPSNVPNIISALKINVGLSFVGVIVGEFLVAQAGLGYLIVYGSQILIRVYIPMSTG